MKNQKYKTINNVNQQQLIINKSKFIGYCYPIENIDQFNNYYQKLKTKYNDATHICYAYSFLDNNVLKESYYESTEPNNSSGKQIFNYLKMNNLVNLVVFIIRYYGVSNLGIGLLTRSYLNCTKLLFDDNNIIDYIKYKQFSLIVPIQEYNNLLFSLKNYSVVFINTQFIDLNVNLTIKIPINEYNELHSIISKYL